MTLKFFLLAFLACQAVNGGVIKKTTIEEAFDLLLAHVRTHAWICTVLFNRLEEGYTYRSYYIRDHAQRISVAAEIALEQSEEFFRWNAEWGVGCFDGVQEQLVLAYRDLQANNQNCINDNRVTLQELLDQTVSYENAAIAMHDKLNATWIECNGNALCWNDLYKQGRLDLQAFNDEFLVYKAGVDRFVDEISGGVSGDLMVCVQSYYKKVYFEKLHDIVKPIPKCLLESKP